MPPGAVPLTLLLMSLAAAPAAAGVPLSLSVASWSGAGLTGSLPTTDKFRVTVTGSPGARVRLSAGGLPAGWIGSWCTDRVCAPFRATVDLPANGSTRVEFQIIPPDDSAAPRHPSARLRASDGTTSSTAVAHSMRLRA